MNYEAPHYQRSHSQVLHCILGLNTRCPVYRVLVHGSCHGMPRRVQAFV